MNDTTPLTDDAVLKDLAQRLSRHRVQHNLTQAQLAYEAGVSKRTVERLESGQSTQLSSLIRILRVLGLLPRLSQLIGEAPTSPIAQLRNKKKTRRRASSPRPKAPKVDSHSKAHSAKVDSHSSGRHSGGSAKVDRHFTIQKQPQGRADRRDDADPAQESPDPSQDANTEPDTDQIQGDDHGRNRRVQWRWDDDS